MKFAAALLASAVSASEIGDFARALPNMIGNGAYSIENIFKASGNGDISWTQCSDDTGKFHLDSDACTVSPDPIKKGTTETFTIRGTTDIAIDVSSVEVDVYFGGNKISSKSNPGGSFTSDVTLVVDSVIPIFAPSGTYTIRATANGNTASGENSIVGCAEGIMHL